MVMEARVFEFTAQNSKFWLTSFPVGVHVNARVQILVLPASVKPLASDPAGGVGNDGDSRAAPNPRRRRQKLRWTEEHPS